MARGADAKLRRRNRKKDEKANSDRIFDDAEGDDDNNGTSDFGDIPMPPGMSNEGGGAAAADDSGDSEEEVIVPKKKKKNKSKSAAGSASGADSSMPMPPKKSPVSGIKRTPLILLIIMTGTTLLPALIFASDYLGNFFQKHHVLGQIGFRLGMGAMPRKRVLSFYEKHDPTKSNDVPDILSKYYGDYPVLIKKLERKYQDYGYFVGWEQDEAPLELAKEQLEETYNVWIHSYWNVYAPQTLKTAARNIRYNLTYLHKKLHKAWKKHIWPMLEPFLGVPKGAKRQKREDAAEGRKRKDATSGSSGSKTRRRGKEFHDDPEDE